MSLAYGRCDAIAAPAWRRACQSLSLRSELISGVAFVCVGVLFSRACVTAAVYLPRIRSLRDREWLWPRFDCSSRAERDREARVWLLMPACSVQWRWSHDDTNPAPLPISTSMSRNPSGLLMASCCALPPSVVLRLCGPLFLCVVAYFPTSPLLRCCIVSRTLCVSLSLFLIVSLTCCEAAARRCARAPGPPATTWSHTFHLHGRSFNWTESRSGPFRHRALRRDDPCNHEIDTESDATE